MESDYYEKALGLCDFDAQTRRIIKARFGFGEGIMRTLGEVAEMENLTREQVRRIEAKAIKQMREVLPHKSAEESK